MKNRNDISEEKICGFTVSENRKKLWVIELDMLEMLEKTCQENNIDYFLVCGSALGAIRHNGFIPWDDDIDIAMLRADFEKFLSCDKKYFPPYIDIQYGLSSSGVDFLLRIRDSRTTGIICDEVDRSNTKGAFIEIYVYDYVINDLRHRIQLEISKKLVAILGILNYPADRSIKAKIKRIILKYIGKEKMWILYVNNCKHTREEIATMVNQVALPAYGSNGTWLVDKDIVKHSKPVKFEYTISRVALRVEEFLINAYGDYWNLPPADICGKHHNSIVYYDPTKSYRKYKNSDIIRRYFNGDYNLSKI